VQSSIPRQARAPAPPSQTCQLAGFNPKFPCLLLTGPPRSTLLLPGMPIHGGTPRHGHAMKAPLRPDTSHLPHDLLELFRSELLSLTGVTTRPPGRDEGPTAQVAPAAALNHLVSSYLQATVVAP